MNDTKQKTRRDIMHDIEGKHFGRCIDQMWGRGRYNLLELMEVRGTGKLAVIVKQFEERVPREGSSKPWPDLAGVWVYVPIKDEGNSWTSLDEALAAFREAHKA